MSLEIEIMYMCVPHTNVNTEQLCKDLTCYLTNCIAGLTNDTTLDIVTITTPSITTEAIYELIGALVLCRITPRYKYQIYKHMQQQAHW